MAALSWRFLCGLVSVCLLLIFASFMMNAPAGSSWSGVSIQIQFQTPTTTDVPAQHQAQSSSATIPSVQEAPAVTRRTTTGTGGWDDETQQSAGEKESLDSTAATRPTAGDTPPAGIGTVLPENIITHQMFVNTSTKSLTAAVDLVFSLNPRLAPAQRFADTGLSPAGAASDSHHQQMLKAGSGGEDVQQRNSNKNGEHLAPTSLFDPLCPFDRRVNYSLCHRLDPNKPEDFLTERMEEIMKVTTAMQANSAAAQQRRSDGYPVYTMDDHVEACRMRYATIGPSKRTTASYCAENTMRRRRKGRSSRVKMDCLPVEVITEVFFPGVVNGFYVEVGALDGIDGSNTLLLANGRQWNGVLIEGSPKYFRKAVKSRSRPGTYVVNRALCDRAGIDKGEGVMFHDTHLKGMGGVTAYYSKEFIKSKGMTNLQREVKVGCTSVSDEVMKTDQRHVDFWSLDVEGAELIALEAFDFKNVSVSVILVELDNNAPEKDRDVRALLRREGFVRFMRIDQDDIFYHPRYIQPKEAFAKCTSDVVDGNELLLERRES